MKIAYIVSTLKLAGPTNQLFNIVKNIDKNKHQVLVITLSSEPNESLWDKFVQHQIPVKTVGLSRVEGIFNAHKVVKKMLEVFKPDVVHTQGIRSDYISATYLPYPNVATLRNYPYEDYVMTYGKLKGWIMAKVHLMTLQKMSAPVACSDSIAKMVGRHGIKLYSVKNGVDTDHFYPATPDEKIMIRDRLNLPKEKKIYVSVGHLSTRKDPLFVINGFLKSKLKDDGLLVLIGDGPLRSDCEELARNEESVHILGRTDRVNDYLRAADYCISSSKAEGLPNSILEALATGLPAVLSDIEPHKEMIELNEKAGLLYVLGDETDFVNKLNQILQKNQSEMKQAALEIIGNHLSAKKMSQNYMEIYTKIVN